MGAGTLRKIPGRTPILKKTVKRSVYQFVVACSTLVALGWLSLPSAAYGEKQSRVSASIAGVVRDAAGMPQIGAVVELLRADSSLAARVFTDRKGFYSIVAVLPGQYALKAMGASFIPTLKQNLHIRATTVVNLTLNSLYDLMQWAPQPQRVRIQSEDDWAWTLRSAESRPLLRWQGDGSPILVWDGSTETRHPSISKRRLRVLASAGYGRFGSGSEQLSVAMQRESSDVGPQRRVAMSADLWPDSSGSSVLMDAMLGFRRETSRGALGASSIQTLAAVMNNPQVGQGGLQAVSLRTWETLQLLDDLEAEAGSDQVVAQLGDGSHVHAALPFGSVTLHHGVGAVEYRVATSRPADAGASESMPGAWLPILSEYNGQLALEHGLHQELGLSTVAGPAQLQFVIYGDSIEAPMIEASGHLSSSEESGDWMLLDQASGLLRTAGPNYSAKGMLAFIESRLPGGNHVKLSYASGDALVMQAPVQPEDISMILKRTHSHRAQMYSLALSGTLDGPGTRWRTSYRWQPDSTVTQVAPFAVNSSEPYLNIYIRQRIRIGQAARSDRPGTGGMEAQLDLRNLLAEGYQPFITSDGSHLYFAQAQRSIRGGLAFTF